MIYEIKENLSGTCKELIKSIDNKLKNNEPFILQMNIYSDLFIELSVTNDFTIEELKYLVYKQCGILPKLQIIIPFEDKKINKTINQSYHLYQSYIKLDKIKTYSLFIKNDFHKNFFSPRIIGNINYDKISDINVDINLDNDITQFSVKNGTLNLK